jgi:hypothetical protein
MYNLHRLKKSTMNQIHPESFMDDLPSISSLGRDWLTKNKFSKEPRCMKFEHSFVKGMHLHV